MDYDVIIVGSGAGGSATAYRLAQSGLRTLLIERGPVLPADGSTLDVGKVIRQRQFKHRELWLDRNGRKFQPSEYANLGGKTKWYGAALLRQAPHEFEADDQHQCPAWPISYDEIAPFYDEAESLLALKRFPTEPDLEKIVTALQERDPLWRREPLPVGLSADILKNPHEAHHFDGFANPHGLKSDAEFSLLRRVADRPNLTIATDMTVEALVGAPDAPEEITGVRCAGGAVHHARRIVLSAGALHSPRLLQSYIEDTGLGTRLPCTANIGRNYKCHLNSALIVFSSSVVTDALRKTTILFHDDFPHSSVQNLGWLDGELIALELPSFAPHVLSDIAGRRAYGFWITTEDGSHPDNRVRCANGHGLAEIDYDADRLKPAIQEHKRLIRTLQAQLLHTHHLGFVKRMPVDNTAHACGTLIAGDDPQRSVVDRNGKVHGLANLYVADGSVMSRSGRVNPAFTIYAWGLRLGGLLHADLMQVEAGRA
jgi:choline dehydrogenase-like flavoprotein